MRPAIEPGHDGDRWPGLGWLRVALLAGIAGGLGAAAWNGAVGERVLSEAIALEGHASGRVHAVVEPFTRAEQQGGMVVGELVLGAGIGMLLAGAALLAGPRLLGTGRRAWLVLAAVGAWSLLVLPAVKYPALPPGVESSLAIDTRQLSYLALVLAGVAGALLARLAWLGVQRGRLAAALAAVALPTALALLLLPSEATLGDVDAALLTRFRLVAVGGQVVFWALVAMAGPWLLERPLLERLRGLARLRRAAT